MTILAIAGTGLIRCFKTCIQAEKIIRQRTQAMYLTQSKILDLEFLYYDVESERRTRLRGDYRESGFPQFWWEASVNIDRKRWAYMITVTTYWEQYGRERSFSMTSLAPRPRYDERLAGGRGRL
jgi:hypothetical protein